MVIHFSFTFKSPALHKYASASSLSKSSKFLILQFLVKYCKLHSIFKILSKSHLLDIFQVWTTNLYINFDFIFSKCLNSPNLYINWTNMWYTDYQNKTPNLCMFNSSRVFIYASKKPFCGTLRINLWKKLDLRMLQQANKNILCKNQIRIQNIY